MAQTLKTIFDFVANDKLSKPLQKMQNALKPMADKIGKLQAAASGFSWKAMIAPALMVAATKPAVDFERAMSGVAATLGELSNSATMKTLGRQARDLGRDTMFTARQAAEAQRALAQAGFNSAQIMQTLPSMLDLAAAGELDMGSAATIVSSVLLGFNADANDTARYVDVLAQAARKSNTNISQMGEAMGMAMAGAQSFGASVEDTATLLGVMANATFTGSQGGVAFSNMMKSLATPNKSGSGALNAIGVNVYDEDNKIRNVVDVLNDLYAAVEPMSERRRNALLADIFDERGMRGFRAFMTAKLSGKFDEIHNALKNANGAAREMRETMENNAQGEMDKLISATTELGIAAGSILLPTMVSIIQKITSFMTKIAELTEKHPVLTKIIVGGTAAFVALSFAISGGAWAALKVIGVIKTLSTVMGVLNAVMAANPAAAIFMALALGALLVVKYWEPIKNFFIGLWDGIKNAFKKGYEYISNIFKKIVAWFQDTWLMKAVRFIYGDVLGIIDGNKPKQPQLLDIQQSEITPARNMSLASSSSGQLKSTTDLNIRFDNMPTGTNIQYSSVGDDNLNMSVYRGYNGGTL